MNDTNRVARRMARLQPLAFTVLTSIGLVVSLPLSAATFTVNQAGGGPAQAGSLAWAVTQSNATPGGPHTINFTTATVQLDSAQGLVPPITRNVIINGDRGDQPDVDITRAPGTTYAAPLFEVFTPQLVWLRNMSIGGAFRNAVYVAPGSDGVILSDLDIGSTDQACLHIRGQTSVLRIVAKDCGNASVVGATAGQRSGIWVETADNVSIHSSFIGIDADGSSSDALANHHYGIVVEASGNVAIGGVGNNRNVISNNQLGGILLTSVDGATIANNYIGVSVDGMSADSNGFFPGIPGFLRGGIVVLHSANVVIGGANGVNTLGNLISANGVANIHIDQSAGLRIYGNLIGTNAAGAGGWPASQPYGIHATGSPGIGGTTQDVDVGDTGNTARANIIAGNGQHGVRLVGAEVGEFRVRGNSIFGNVAGGIQLASGANSNIGAPTVQLASTNTVSGTAPLDVAGSFGQVDVYRDLAGQGRVYVGSTAIDPDFGTWSLTVNLTGFENTWAVTATSNTDGRGTSQFSAPMTITPGVTDLIFENGFQNP